MTTSNKFEQHETEAQLLRYGGAETDDYSSDSNNSDTYSDNSSDCESNEYNDYGSDYESDYESDIGTSPLSKVEKQKVNVTYYKRRKKFNNKFTAKDLLNKIREIASFPAKDMMNNKGSLEDIHL
nr:15449_t:CDS:1 [Entrophospora candida]